MIKIVIEQDTLYIQDLDQIVYVRYKQVNTPVVSYYVEFQLVYGKLFFHSFTDVDDAVALLALLGVTEL